MAKGMFIAPALGVAHWEDLGLDIRGSINVESDNVDWSKAGIFRKTLEGSASITFSNLQLNKTITIILTGNYTLAWPSYMTADYKIEGTYDGTKLNYIRVHCTSDTPGSEEVWWSIKTKGV